MDNSGDILQLCRLCLVKNDVNISIFEEQGDIREILQKISSCLPVKVSREDKLPKKICDGCSYKLDMFYEFWNSTANAEKQLLTWLGEAEVNAKLTDGSVPTVAQQMKPTETVVKQEAIDPSDIHTEENDDDKSYMFPQKFSSEEAGSSATATSNEEPPPPKRARRTAAVKAQIAMDPESDDDEDSGEPITKVEDESEESEGEDHEPSFVDVPSTSADDQPGPSGVGKDGAEAPSPQHSKKRSAYLKEMYVKYSLKDCSVLLTDIKLNKSLKFVNNRVKLPSEGRRKYTCYICWKKFLTLKDLNNHKNEDHEDEDEMPEQGSPEMGQIVQDKSLQHKSKSVTKNTSIKTDNTPKMSPSPLHKCETCKASFASIDEVKKHPANKCKFLCGVCDRNYNTMYAFTVHILQHKINIFKSRSSTHRAAHKCTLCSESFEEYFQLRTHGIIMHKGKSSEGGRNVGSENTGDQAKDINGSEELCCELCFDIFSSQEDLQEHMEFHKQLSNKSNDKINEGNNADDLIEVEKEKDLDDIPDSAIQSLHTSVMIPIDEDIKNEVEEKLEESQEDTAIQASFNLEDIEKSKSPVAEEENKSPVRKDAALDAPIEEASEEYEFLKSDSNVPVDHYKCKKCDRIFMNLSEHNDHIKYNKCTIIEQCKTCSQTYERNSDLYLHIMNDHRHLAICKFCFECFYLVKKLDEHKLLHHFKTFKNLCKICFQCFASYEEFNVHLKEQHLNL